ncbi:MAG: hypothetical protein HY519_03525 [Candidatus Aenigmarchaeota archaeon]|nr:hypothetical protein [Candidatus Aenigmarchaeota archaeon]
MIKGLAIFPHYTVTGKQTIKAVVETENGVFSASVPFGTSTGANEAARISADAAISMSASLAKQLVGQPEDFRQVEAILKELDGTPNLAKLGANLILAIALATARAQTANRLYSILPSPGTFPIPVVNTIGGAQHGGGTDWQEFLLIPHKAASPAEAFQTVWEAYLAVGAALRAKGVMVGINKEHAYTARLDDLQTLELLDGIAGQYGLLLGIDFAASGIWDGRQYSYAAMNRKLMPESHLEFVENTAKSFKRLFFLEDAVHEEDFQGMAELTARLKGRLIVGDDIYCTNPARLEQGIKLQASNAIIIKPDQIGTLTDTMWTVEIAQQADLELVPSHRSNETSDDWLADLALAFGARYIKIGVGYDVPKHNRLVEAWQAR